MRDLIKGYSVQETDGRASHIIGYLLVFYIALIAYVSLTPFTGWQTSRTRPWEFLMQGWPRYATRFDMAINFLAYLPFGLLLYAKLALSRGRLNAIALSLIFGIGLSLVLETAQEFLEFRIASLADLLFNSAGSAAGALLSAWLGRTTNIQTLFHRWRCDLFLPSTTVDIGVALLCVWLISQLNPTIPFFGAGIVTGSPMGYDEGYMYQPPADAPFALGTALNFCGLGLLVTTLMRVRSHALVFCPSVNGTGVLYQTHRCVCLAAAGGRGGMAQRPDVDGIGDRLRRAVAVVIFASQSSHLSRRDSHSRRWVVVENGRKLFLVKRYAALVRLALWPTIAIYRADALSQ